MCDGVESITSHDLFIEWLGTLVGFLFLDNNKNYLDLFHQIFPSSAN